MDIPIKCRKIMGRIIMPPLCGLQYCKRNNVGLVNIYYWD